MNIDAAFVGVVGALLSGIVQALKQVPGLKDRPWLIPFLALALGVGCGLGAFVSEIPADAVLMERLLSGLAAGLVSVGLYEAIKHATPGGSGPA